MIGLAADFADSGDSGEWMATSAASAAHWIAGVADIEVCTAREWIRVGRLLRVLPLIAELFEGDELSYSTVRTLSRIATPENEQQLAAIAADGLAGASTRAIVFEETTSGSPPPPSRSTPPWSPPTQSSRSKPRAWSK